jgi:hypothetical protein
MAGRLGSEERCASRYVLKNPGDPKLSPWYPVAFGDELRTPEWTFRKGDLRRF